VDAALTGDGDEVAGGQKVLDSSRRRKQATAARSVRDGNAAPAH